MMATVIKRISNYYHVLSDGQEFICQVKGRLKKERVQVFIGDRVLLGDVEGDTAQIVEVLPRQKELNRPPIANVDQIVLVFATDRPMLSPKLVDRFLLLAEAQGIPPIICLNKVDLVSPEQIEEILAPYKELGYPIVQTAAKLGQVDELKSLFENKLTVFAGPSGVGKSKLLNALQPGLELVSGEVSEKIGRGRHTTRYATLYPLFGGLVADTPGFSHLEFSGIEPEELAWYYPEMRPFIPECKLSKCLHHQEPQCSVKEKANIHSSRYDNYLEFLEELIALHLQQQSTSQKVESIVKKTGERRLLRLGQEPRVESRQKLNQRLRELAETVEREESDW